VTIALPGTLSGPSRLPVSGGNPTRLVILLHGRGSNGEDLLDLQRFWGRMVPEARFIAPDAPFPSDNDPQGREWYKAPDRRPESILAGVSATAPILDAFITQQLQQHGLDESDAALVGFSQGTMMALHIGVRRERPFAGIIGYSGRLIAAHLLPGQVRSRPPVLLVHGTADMSVPLQAMTEAEASLRATDIAVETLLCPGTGHSIDEEGLVRGGIFLHKAFNSPKP
jgi:phospholipase/carboxylesterase